MIFNVFVDVDEDGKLISPITIDKYLNIDIIFAVYSMVVFQYITILDPQIFISDSKKNNIDYMVALLLVLALIRFFILFLAVESVSKMLLTLIYMMIDVGTFLFIMICYLAFSTLLFSALYQDTN